MARLRYRDTLRGCRVLKHAELLELPESYRQLALDRLTQIKSEPDCADSNLILPALAFSDFFVRECRRDATLVDECLRAELPAPGSYRDALRSLIEQTPDDTELMAMLRRFRNREMARIAWADLAGLLPLDAVMEASSELADVLIDEVLRHLYSGMCERWGVPRNSAGDPQQLVVLGMGKLGGHELNFSSDIDLIFAFPENGETDGNKAIDNAEFFLRLGQRLIKTLNETTADGFVYRVDMRLRPFGDSGPLAVSFNALETYYQSHGREWERYAMIKARVVAGDLDAGEQLLAMLRPFVYRRYLDYGAIESLRDLKQKITAEVSRKGMQHNIKLGPGGIREIEFIGQVFQLIRGGQNVALQTRSIMQTLTNLVDATLLADREADQLLAAYRFLRRLENRLQMHNDEQLHSLPQQAAQRDALVASMGYEGTEEFERALDAHRKNVEAVFDSVFKVESDKERDQYAEFTGFWQVLGDDDPQDNILQAHDFADATLAIQRLGTFKSGRFYVNLSTRARDRLDALVPPALALICEADNPDETLNRLLSLLRAIAGRSVYLSILVDNPAVLSRLIMLLSTSAWVAEFVARHPLVIDELLNPSSDDAPYDRERMESEARQSLERLPDADLGEQMDVLRQYKQTQLLRIVSADLDGVIDLMQVSSQLSWLAEALLQVVSDLTWDELVVKHGRPTCVVDGETVRPGFGIVAYGKLGGIELGYGSDLDIVFLHESEGERQQTDGEKPVDNAVFFARLAQKLVHFISTLTPAGTLYEVDTRLRPNGASGLLVSSIDAFADYQSDQAWTWEHQALVRAKMVVGSSRLRRRFTQVRNDVLCRSRDRRKLAGEVAAMRDRMFRELCRGNAKVFDLKQDRGAVADIEFMVQYFVLAWAQQYPALMQFTGNFRLLELIGEQGIIPVEQVDKLAQSYLAHRTCIHRRVLQGESTLVERAAIDAQTIDRVVNIWQNYMPSAEKSAGGA